MGQLFIVFETANEGTCTNDRLDNNRCDRSQKDGLSL